MTAPIFNPNNYFFNIHSLPFFISGILIILESIFVFFQNRKSALNSSFVIATFAAGMWLTGIGIMYCSLYESLAFTWTRYYCWLGIIFITPGVYLFSVVWEGSKRAKLISLPIATGFIFYIFCTLSTYFIQGVWHYPWGFYPKAGPLEVPFLIWFATLALLSFQNFIRSYRKEQILIRKKQTKLIIIAFAFGFVGSLDFIGNFGIPLYAFGGPFAMAFSTVMAYAIVNYKLMEIETVIHKTIAWFFTSAALVAPLVALLYFTRLWYMRLNVFQVWSYFGAVLLCFLFFVKTFQPKVDNFFQRGRVYLESVLNRFSEELVHLRGLEEVINKITKTITTTLGVGKVTIMLYNDRLKKLVTVGSIKNSLEVNIQLAPQAPFLKWLSQNDLILDRKFVEIDPRYESIRSEAKEYFQALEAAICIPLILNERLIGLINLGMKTNLKSFSASDHYFLTRLKNQTTIAVSNSLVYDRVEELVKIRTNELIQTQEQLIQAEKLATVGTLAGGVAHEINNPLAAVLTNAQMLLMEAKTEDEKESLKLIEQAAKRCREIVQKLMVYSRKPLGGREIKEVDLEQALVSVLSFLEYQLNQDNIKITKNLQNPPFLVKGSQTELEQVFTNLILNAKDAIKHAKKSGTIDMSLTKQNDKIIIKVKDDGIGISKEHLSKIFDPFYTTKDVGKGTGLGLSICQSIIEQHNGNITVESEEGKGTTFIITLPMQQKGAMK